MKVHPIADAYPESTDSVLESIRECGQLHAIVMLGDEILDGRGRANACRQLRIEPKTVQYRGKKDWASLVTYVRAVNEHRRHMTASQRAVVAFKLTKLAAECAQNDKIPGDSASKKHKFVLSQDGAAKALGVSTTSVDNASKVVQQGAAAVVEAVEVGEVSVSDAAAVAGLPKAKQTAALKKVRTGKAKTLRKAISGGTSFDPAELEAKVNGKPKGKNLTAPTKKLALDYYGKLLRALDRLKISADVDTEMRTILKAIKAA